MHLLRFGEQKICQEPHRSFECDLRGSCRLCMGVPVRGGTRMSEHTKACFDFTLRLKFEPRRRGWCKSVDAGAPL